MITEQPQCLSLNNYVRPISREFNNIVIMATNAQLQPTVRKSGGIYVQVKGRITMNYYCNPVPQLQGNFCDDHFQISEKRTRMRNTDIVECCLFQLRKRRTMHLRNDYSRVELV